MVSFLTRFYELIGGIYLEWNIHPFKEEPLKSFLLITFLFILMILLFFIFPNIPFLLSVMIVMILSLRAYFFKSEYKLEHEYLNVKMLVFQYKKQYADFKKVYIGEAAFLMSPFTYKTKLNKYRGIYIPFPKNLRDRIILFISERFEDVVITER
jgi:hypothetical protein